MPINETAESSAQHAVPQNIMDVEFKLIGDLTMRQFSYLCVCGGLAYLNFEFIPGIFKFPVSLGFVVLGLSLAFVPIQERGLDQWIINFFRAVYSPTQRIWKKSVTLPSAFSYANLAMVKQELITLAPTSSRRKLEEFLDYQQDSGPEDPLDIPEEEYIMKVRKAFGEFDAAAAAAAPTTPATPIAPAASVAVTPTSVIPTSPAEVPVAGAGAREAVEVTTSDKVSPAPSSRHAPPPAPSPKPTIPSRSPDRGTESKSTEVSDPTPVQKLEQVRSRARDSRPARPTQPTQPVQVSRPAPTPPVTPVRPPAPTVPRRVTQRRVVPSSPALDPITPDMHSGRRFVSFLPSQGELILPIRGERVLKSSKQIESEEDVMDKARQLQEFLAQIRKNEPLVVQPSTLSTTVSDAEQLSRDAKRFADNLKSRTDDLAKQIDTVKSEIDSKGKDDASKQKKEVLDSLTKQKDEISRQYDIVTGQVSDIQSKLHSIPPKGKPALDNKARTPSPRQVSGPNIPTGFVKDFAGRPVSGLVLLFKNQRGDPVRATKTDSVGRFALTTPLSNGAYTTEASPTNNSGLSFDIISFEAKGQPIASLELVGK
jgi:hypothetical protein